MRTRSVVPAAVVALALATAGCGGDSAEKKAEDAIEEATGGSADVDINDGTMKITTDTGNIVVSGDGDGVTVESDEGTMQSGAGTKVPEGFPKEVPLPDGDVQTAVKANDSFNLLFKVGDAKKAFAGYLSALESAGFEVTDRQEGEANDQFFGSASAEGKGWRVQVGAAGGRETILTVNVDPAG